jgi:hypothetical protein
VEPYEEAAVSSVTPGISFPTKRKLLFLGRKGGIAIKMWFMKFIYAFVNSGISALFPTYLQGKFWNSYSFTDIPLQYALENEL